MTREEALKEYGLSDQGEDVINSIFDEIKSRTCENCKHKGCAYMMLAYETEGLTSEEFGCNQFERVTDGI